MRVRERVRPRMLGRRAEWSPAELKRSAAVGGGSPRLDNLPPSGDVCTRALEVNRRQVAERRVDALAVVERLDVIEDAGPSLLARPVVLVVDEFGLQGVEEALLGRVVVAVALAAHAGDDAVRFEHSAELGGRVLHSAIGVMNQARGWPALIDCHA